MTTIDDYQIGRYLGRGKYGLVYLARENKSGLVVALKVLYKQFILKERCEGQLRRELEIHTNLRHPNITRLYTWFQDATRIFLVLEYCSGGELYSYLTQFTRLPVRVVSKITHDVLAALQFAHKKSILHRDIKLENVLCSYSPELIESLKLKLSTNSLTDSQGPETPENLLQFTFKLSDFGWSVHHPGVAQKSVFNQSRRKTQCGTLDYLPPQLVLGQPYHSGCDIWSLGVMCYELLAGQPPFYHETLETTKANIAAVKFSYPEGMPDVAKDFIKKCLVKDQDKRATADELTKHQFVKLWESQ
ncbi:Aurora_kinase [Hexamita inflata]|uniref:Aurora kinase n=2 Tax=Hexamita inflata TaxID=28002 RepID=A0AA86RCF9_9EUKA|nr:Aurora kinase [Hexamita inflata]